MEGENPRVVVIVPARLGSTRVPRKPLQRIGGREVVLRVCDAASRAARVDEVGVATDSEEIRRVVEKGGYRAWMTSPDHPTGTDRVAEAARSVEADLVINVQGDEPFLPPGALDLLVEEMNRETGRPLGTLVVPLEGEDELHDPNVVKVVIDRSGGALYFSRAPVPWRFRETEPARWKHVGVYAFRREALFRFVSLPRTELEMSESLEQLRALDHGMAIHVGRWPVAFHGVETMEDLERARRIVAGEAEASAGDDGTVEARDPTRGEESGS
ncbi:MAG: 3-deoxy-manno-octulosonate cytidylyltransferase [Candidatus Eisenbacteria bacterium]